MRVLLLEDDEVFGSAVHTSLTRTGYAVDWLRKGQDLNIALRSHRYDCVLLDLGLPGVSGESLLVMLRQREPDICLIVMTARGGIQDCVADARHRRRRLHDQARRPWRTSRTSASGFQADTDCDDGVGRRHRIRSAQALRGATFGDVARSAGRRHAQGILLLEAFLRRKSQVLTRDQLAEVLPEDGESSSSQATPSRSTSTDFGANSEARSSRPCVAWATNSASTTSCSDACDECNHGLHSIFVKPSQAGSEQIAPPLMIAVWPMFSLIWNRDASAWPFERQKASAAGLPQAVPHSRQ